MREIEAPTGFVLSDETFAVTVDKDGTVIEIEIENTLIRGTVQLTKIDKDYPDTCAALTKPLPASFSTVTVLPCSVISK